MFERRPERASAFRSRSRWLRLWRRSIGAPDSLITRHSRPYTPQGFGNASRDWCDQAGLPQCSAHGLRKACARRLAESGAQVSEIMSSTGHRDPRMALYYAREAEKKALAD